MASEIDTASNMEDLFSRIITFLTTNASLVADTQQWQVLRQRRDNIAALTTSIVPNGTSWRSVLQTCRYDSRSLNVDNESSATATIYSNNFSAGVSHVTWQLRQAAEISAVRLRAPVSASYVTYMIRNYRLQYSDDGAAWTTCLTVASSPIYTSGEWKDFAVSSPGSHMYWRIVIDSTQNGSGTAVSWQGMLLLEADGTVANHFGSEVIFKSTGTAGTDEIFTGIRSEYDEAAGWYNLFMNGYTGYDPNETSWLNQPGALPGYGETITCAVPMVPCWNAATPYWFSANGRSFRFAIKVSTSYEGGYLGFILPYATPGQYPYPLAVGGSLVPRANGSASGDGVWSTLYLRGPGGTWGYYANRGNPTLVPDGIYGPNQSLSAPYVPSGAYRSVWPHCMNDQWSTGKLPYRECLGGGYIAQPCILVQRGPTTQIVGELEGTYVISGYANSPENTTTIGGNPAVLFQHAYRNTVHEFWAITL
jgi:hypothetical protein